MEDFERALSEIKPAFGAVTETLEGFRLNGMIDSGPRHRDMMATCRKLVEQVRCFIGFLSDLSEIADKLLFRCDNTVGRWTALGYSATSQRPWLHSLMLESVSRLSDLSEKQQGKLFVNVTVRAGI